MSNSDRRPYLTATTLTQALLDAMQDNLEFGLRIVAEVETPDGTLYLSNRHGYVGPIFYEALSTIPAIKRTVGDWLAEEVEFSSLKLTISNVDGRFNKYLPGGASFAGWIGKKIRVRAGIGEVEATYNDVFTGTVTDVGGLARDKASLSITARDRFDALRAKFPKTVFTKDAFPHLEDDKVGLGVPVIYGDWTTRLRMWQKPAEPPLLPAAPIMVASVPCFVVNGADTAVQAGTANVQAVIAEHALRLIDTANVWLLRSDVWTKLDAGDITVEAGNRSILVKQGGTGGTSLIDGSSYTFETSDEFFVRCKGKSVWAGTGYEDNAVAIAQDILVVQGGLDDTVLDANWYTVMAKSSPAESNIAGTLARAHIQEAQEVVAEVTSLLEQVRVEMFTDRSLKLKLLPMHFDAFDAAPSFTIRNWDVARDTFLPEADDHATFNRVKAEYGLDPQLKQQAWSTVYLRNQAAIDQMGKQIAKKIEFPNLYIEAQVLTQLTEILKLASASPEHIGVTLTPRAFLLDIGQGVAVDVRIGSTIFEQVPAMIREINYDPSGLRIPARLMSFQLVPFTGHSPGLPGIVGGQTATITQES